jgi:hypothetical protein
LSESEAQTGKLSKPKELLAPRDLLWPEFGLRLPSPDVQKLEHGYCHHPNTNGEFAVKKQNLTFQDLFELDIAVAHQRRSN